MQSVAGVESSFGGRRQQRIFHTEAYDGVNENVLCNQFEVST